jgi:hypothetical protein
MGRLRLLAVISALVALVGVASVPAYAATAERKKPKPAVPAACKLITKLDATTFLGVPEVEQSGTGASCMYVAPDGYSVVGIKVTPLTAPDVAFYKKQIKSAQGATFPKLGDVASNTGAELQILKGKLLFDVTVRKGDASLESVAIDPASLDALGHTALSRA